MLISCVKLDHALYSINYGSSSLAAIILQELLNYLAVL